MSDKDSPPNGAALASRRPSKVLEHILVGVGGSSPSLTALRYGIHLARAARSRLEALIVEDLHLPIEAEVCRGDVLSRLVDEAEALIRLRWDEAQRKIERLSEGHAYPVVIRRERGRVTDRIVEAGNAVSLIVLGKRGCREEHGGLLGSNAELTLRRTHRPVLLTPDTFVAPKRVLVAHGGKTMGVAALGIGLTIAKSLQLPLTIMTVEEDLERRRLIWHEIRGLVSKVGIPTSFDAETGEVGEAIIGHADPKTLLVMGAYGHSRLYRMVLGSVTEEVMRAASGPVLLSGK